MVLPWNLDQQLKSTRQTKQYKKIDDDVIPANYDFIFIFPIYGQFGAIQKLYSRCTVCKTYIFTFSLKVAFCLTNTENN